jgi:8-oxo-dGTP diphosphatase
MSYTYDYPRPAVAADLVILGLGELALDQSGLRTRRRARAAVARPDSSSRYGLSLLLIRRRHAPFANAWALPGGFVEPDEDLEPAAARELNEETGLSKVHLHQLRAFGRPGRDPRGRVISIVHFGFVERTRARVQAASDAAEVGWFSLAGLPPLAFDHGEIIASAREHLHRALRGGPPEKSWLPRRFTLDQLRGFYESIFHREFEQRRFERAMLRTEWFRSATQTAGREAQFAVQSGCGIRESRTAHPVAWDSLLVPRSVRRMR